MKRKCSSVLVSACLLLCVCLSCFAQVPEGGGTTTTRSVGDSEVLWHDFFNLYNCSTTAVYNESGGTSTSDGWVRVIAYPDYIGIEAICVTMPPAGTVTVEVQGRHGDYGTGSVLFTHTFNGTDTSSLNVPISEKPDYVRVSLVNSESETESVIVRLKALKGKR